jgi:peptidoglycan/xylan/chitin deacetylase (PgdA/CDA1 family)
MVKLDRKAIAKAKFCALTFDDGPDGVYTPQVAAVLKQYGVPATFFCVGTRVKARPETVRALAAAGHEIGNHSWSHADFTKLSAADCKSQIERCQKQLAACGVKARWFRPPYGAFDRSVVRQIKDSGLRPVLWSVDPQDWAKPGADRIATRVLNGSGNGAVILLHSTNAQTVEALPRIIEKLRARGFTFVTMSQWELAATGHGLPETGGKLTPLPALPALPNGAEPPSFREVEPGLPQPPSPPSIGPGLLASGKPADEERAVKTVADPQWVEATAEEFEAEVGVAPARPEMLAGASTSDAGRAGATPTALTSAPDTATRITDLAFGPNLHVVCNFAGELGRVLSIDAPDEE